MALTEPLVTASAVVLQGNPSVLYWLTYFNCNKVHISFLHIASLGVESLDLSADFQANCLEDEMAWDHSHTAHVTHTVV